MNAQIELYGVLQRLAGASVLKVQLPENATAADALAQLPGAWAQRLDNCACAIGEELVPRTQVLHEGVRLALIPPVSGG